MIQRDWRLRTRKKKIEIHFIIEKLKITIVSYMSSNQIKKGIRAEFTPVLHQIFQCGTCIVILSATLVLSPNSVKF